MAVTREQVIDAYRLILGRDPESEAVVEGFLNVRDWQQLRDIFFGSQEFALKNGADGHHALLVGRYLDVREIDVDLRCSGKQLQQMFDRIAAEWKKFGETEPHWSVLVSDDFRQENLAENIERFYASGKPDIDIHLNFLRRSGLSTHFRRAMDFGCGVGRLSLALAAHADAVVGVDISPPHLALARERAGTVAAGNVTFEAIGSVDDLAGLGLFDLVISRIVLQHNPPPVMAAIYRRLLDALTPGGVAIVQMPTYIVGQRFAAESYLSSEQPAMEMNALSQDRIFEIIDAAGCVPVEIREDGAAGGNAISHTIAVRKRDGE
ncbi:MAG: class I SAM-dependent methyltransferase [Pseudomonadota bacterium]